MMGRDMTDRIRRIGEKPVSRSDQWTDRQRWSAPKSRPRVDDTAKKAVRGHRLVETWMRACTRLIEKVSATKVHTRRPLPIKLHKDATIVAQYNVKLPDDVQAELPGIVVARCRCAVRLENETSMEKVQHHYQRFAGKTKRDKTHDIRAGQWLDSLTNGSASRIRCCRRYSHHQRRQTETPIPSSANSKGQLEWVVVEILTIEIPEPKNPDPVASSNSRDIAGRGHRRRLSLTRRSFASGRVLRQSLPTA
jgi:hypothetical protein